MAESAKKNKPPINYEAWSRGAITFIREQGLEQQFQDWCGGFPCPIASDSEMIRSGAKTATRDERELANMFVAAPDMLEALRLHKAWADSEAAGPDYGGQTRDTHPDGERIWRAWWNNQLDLCARAQKATNAALDRAEGRA